MAQKRKSDITQRAKWVEKTLTDALGPRPYNPDAYDTDLIGALVATILSQHTSDLNSGRAYLSLKSAFPGGWDDVRLSDVDSIADAIRSGGLADVKAQRIKNLLLEIRERTGSLTLDQIRAMSDRDAMSYLTEFHGVGPKTAACVLMFNMGRGVIPVDTHVHRVALRLGLVPEKTSAGSTQDLLLSMVGRRHAYSFHVHLIEHGRTICHAQRPKCEICPLNTHCDYFHDRSNSSAVAPVGRR